MLEMRTEIYLTKEALVRDGVSDFATQDLDGDSGSITRVLTQVHSRHSTAAELTIDAIELADSSRRRGITRASII
jgi:hypothetical protein